MVFIKEEVAKQKLKAGKQSKSSYMSKRCVHVLDAFGICSHLESFS